MRALVLAIVAIQIALAAPARAQNAPAPDRPISEILPLFERNHCVAIRDPADQLFCGDPQLNEAGAKLNVAIQDRLNRLPDRGIAIAENAEWIRNRNSSCGIFGRQPIPSRSIDSVKACLVAETEERIAILSDPNFDCLATNTTAGMLICSEPSLAIASQELAGRVLALIGKLKGDEARDAFSEYARWTRARDRKCDLVGKDNIPLEELAPSETCLGDDISERTAEIAAAKGDPKKVFGRRLALTRASPGADAVDLCVAQIHEANACENFLRVNRVSRIDSEVNDRDAQVKATVEMVVLSPFAACSPIATGCTGTCWDIRAGQAKPTPGSRESFAVAHKLKIQKSFGFQKNDNGSWRCSTTALAPVDLGIATSGP